MIDYNSKTNILLGVVSRNDSHHTLTKVQTTAASAVNWCHQKGGHVEPDDVVGKLASLGACGKYPANVERDMQSMLSTFGKRLGVSISWIPCRICWEQKMKIWSIIEFPFVLKGVSTLRNHIYIYTAFLQFHYDFPNIWDHWS